MAAQQKTHVIVIGAGVIGLQIAITLLDAGYAVTVLAEFWPDSEEALQSQEWASPWAGAQWRAHAAANTPAAAWESATYQSFAALAAAERDAGAAPGLGPSSIAAVPFTHYWNKGTAPTEPLWWKTLSDDFGVISKEYLPADVAYGTTITSFTLRPDAYLRYLLDCAQSKGVQTVRTKLEPPEASTAALLSAARAALPPSSDVFAFVNATGLAASSLIGDAELSPNRGQTLLVRGETKRMVTWVGDRPTDVLAIIPRVGTGTTIVGSTRGVGRRDGAEDAAHTAWLLQEGARWAPELLEEKDAGEGMQNGTKEGTDGTKNGLGGMHVLAANVGFRPRRTGGARVEREEVDGERVVHAYGHEGAGYQQSVGTAERVLELLKGME